MTIEIDSHALMAVFLPQADENLLAMEQAVLELERETDPTGPLAELFRHAHTLKSDAAAVGFNELGSAAHQFEDQLEGLKERRIDLDQELISGLLEIVDGLREQLDRSKSGDAGISQKLHRALTGLGKRLGSQVDLPRGDRRGDPQLATVNAGSDSGRTSRPHTLRVEIAKLDQLTSLTGELAIARGRFFQLLSQPKVSSAVLTEEFHRSEQLYGALHELAISLRMVPIGPVFAQYGRLVRDLAVSMGKKVRLEVEGGEVEIDNSILQLLADPLTHLIRNALDHGIEGPAERLEQGKPAEGVVRLIARQLANRVVIQVHDDGRGIDPENVLRRARELGRIGDHEQPTPPQLQALVLEAGFSTTDEVTELSGRGVGLDVVRRNVELLRGTVSIDGEPGVGARIELNLPLTLAIIDGLLVSSGDQTYVIPIDSIAETTDMPAAPGTDEPRGFVAFHDTPVPFVRLGHLFDHDCKPTSHENVVVIGIGDRLAGLVVDKVHGKQQVVVQPLARIFHHVAGLAGCTILNTGHVALILDAEVLLSEEAGRTSRPAAQNAQNAQNPQMADS